MNELAQRSNFDGVRGTVVIDYDGYAAWRRVDMAYNEYGRATKGVVEGKKDENMVKGPAMLVRHCRLLRNA